MFFWKSKDNPWIPARAARKNPPILITMIICFALFVGYIYIGDFVRDLISKGVSALSGSAIKDLPLNDDIYEINHTYTFIILVPIIYFYMKYIEGRSAKTFSLSKNDSINSLLTGFILGTVILAVILGFLSIFHIFTIKGPGKFDLLTFILGLLSVAIASFSIEYFFRGAILSSFGARNHPLIAIAASAFIYALCNYIYYNADGGFNFLFFINHFLLGCIFGIIVFRTKNVWITIGARFALMFFSQLIFNIPWSGFTYIHTLFSIRYTTVSIWFTVKSVLGIDTGFCMFAFLLIVLALSLFIPVKSTETGKDKYFRHVQEKNVQPIVHSQPADNTEETIKNDINESSPILQEDINENNDDWEEETTRDISTPNYNAPEDYLKK